MFRHTTLVTLPRFEVGAQVQRLRDDLPLRTDLACQFAPTVYEVVSSQYDSHTFWYVLRNVSTGQVLERYSFSAQEMRPYLIAQSSLRAAVSR